MIAKLSGRIDSLADGSAVIDVGGVGYLVFCSGRTLARLDEGSPISLLVETQVREDGIYLYGFLDAGERRWFRMLIAIQGVGPKVALAILGVHSPHELSAAIASGDRSSLTRAAGVGSRLASRIMGELKDKIVALPAGVVGGAPLTDAAAGGMAADAISALVNLGFRAVEAQSAVTVASGRLGPDAALDALIRSSLAELAGHEQRP